MKYKLVCMTNLFDYNSFAENVNRVPDVNYNLIFNSFLNFPHRGSMTTSLVEDFYAHAVRHEWRRLVKDAYHRLEFDTTLYYLSKYLPANGRLLDAGGGPGRYTIELARRGYQMVLEDLTPANLEFARRQIKRAGVQKNVKELAVGSITDLACFDSNTFDAVLCSGGPLSHVVDSQQRARAISELVRVARPDALLFVSVIGRLSVLVEQLVAAQHEIESPIFKQVLETGDYLGGYGFTACHFFLPEELKAAFNEQPVSVLEMVGLEGISSHHARQLNQLAKNPVRWQTWLETHYATCTHPGAVGISEHILIICQKS